MANAIDLVFQQAKETLLRRNLLTFACNNQYNDTGWNESDVIT